MNYEALRQLASVVRELPLEDVLLWRGAERDRRDRHQWETEQGRVSVTGAKFMNWHRAEGGGGAIDLAMHLCGLPYREAVLWLAGQAGITPGGAAIAPSPPAATATAAVRDGERPVRSLQLPVRDDRRLGQVRRYLTEVRHLPAVAVESLIACGRLYADGRGNAVFMMVAGRPNRAVGAELRGTGRRAWRGLARGSRKDAGYFWTGNVSSARIVLCESAIDAMSVTALQGDCLGISTAGVRSDPRWLASLLARGYAVRCGFDADAAGDRSALAMQCLYGSIERLRPSAKDWNDELSATRR